MKLLVVFALFALSVAALPVENRVSGENGWYVPQTDGSMKWMDTEEAEYLLAELGNSEERSILSGNVDFYLYTSSNPTTPEKITATSESILASHFNGANPTRFTIHGWNSNYRDGMNSQIAKAWLSHGDYNIIAVDWSRGRSLEYASSVMAVPRTGERIATFIEYLHANHGLTFDTLQVIGHSLGAHVAGFTGKNVQSGQVHTIIGLDPALPLFSYENPSGRLSSTDAFYVESITTNGGMLGFLRPIGKGAFYPNGGRSQPGCGVDLAGGCAHSRSVHYYIEAVNINNFPSIRCENYEYAVNADCGSTFSSIRMGAVTNAYMADGDFYVPVNEEFPFGVGA